MQTVEISKSLDISFRNKRQVMTSDAKIIGKVYGAEVDTKRWIVSDILTEFDSSILSDADVEHPKVRKTRVAIPTDKIQKVSDVIELSVSLNDLLATLEN